MPITLDDQPFTKSNTIVFIKDHQSVAKSAYKWDVLIFVLLSAQVGCGIYNYVAIEDSKKCEPRDLAMWQLVNTLNTIPLLLCFMWGAFAKYKHGSDAKLLAAIKHDNIDHDPEAHSMVVHQAAIFRHGNIVRLGLLALTLTGCVIWDIIGWIWYNSTTDCNQELKTTTYNILWWETAVDAIITPCICMVLVASMAGQASTEESGSDVE